MSYILEALRKSDQQRQRGATPTLQAVQVTLAAPKRPLFMYYGVLAVIMLGAGIMIGWLRPWQPEQPPSETELIATNPPVLISQQAAPTSLPVPPEMLSKTAQEFPALNPTPAVQPALGFDTRNPDNHAPSSSGAPSAEVPISEKAMPENAMPVNAMPEKPGSPAGVAQEQRAIPLNELPLQIRQEIPAMAIQLHAYSNNPPERLVSINSIRLREGGSLTPDLRLERITPDGMIFNYKGYRFQRGVR